MEHQQQDSGFAPGSPAPSSAPASSSGKRTTPCELKGAAGGAAAEPPSVPVVSLPNAIANSDAARRFGIEFWKPLLIALVAFLFLELFYQQWISRRRTA